MVQDSAIIFENLPFYCPNSTSALLTFKPTRAIFTERSEEVQYGTLLFIGRVLILLGFHDTLNLIKPCLLRSHAPTKIFMETTQEIKAQTECRIISVPHPYSYEIPVLKR